MNKLYNLICQALGDGVIYGTPTGETNDTVISLSMGESEESRGYLGTSAVLKYPTVNVTVYSNDYLQGFNRFESAKSILSGNIVSKQILHKLDKASYYDKDLKKHVFTAQYKILN